MKLKVADYHLAYEFDKREGAGVMFCPGFNSSMLGIKAERLKQFCKHEGLSFVRFDYRGHGQSGGDFGDACISTWLEDALAIIDQVAIDKLILVGSSMGGWIALLAAMKRPNRVVGLLLLACAADMTKFYPARVSALPRLFDHKGRAYYSVDNRYDDQQKYAIYQKLIDDGSAHFVLDGPINLDIPVTLMHGSEDDVVQWQRSQAVVDRIVSKNVKFSVIDGGDHRLSKETDLKLMCSLLNELLLAAN